MKKNIRYIFAVAVITLSGTAVAQDLESAYFMEGYAYGHQMNPAKDYDRTGYVSMPALGNINMGMGGNLSLSDIFKMNPNGSGLTTFLNPNISYIDALSGFSSNNKMMMDTRIQLLSVGFHALGGFNTIDIGMRMNYGASAPYDVFSMAKNLSNQSYDISGTRLTASAWAEIALGHSRQINKAIRVGAKVKGLIAGGRIDAIVNKGTINLVGDNQWQIDADIEMNSSIKGLEFQNKTTYPKARASQPYQEVDWSTAKINNPGISGGGLAFDLGVEWDPSQHSWSRDWMKGFKLSASVLDLGFIYYKENTQMANINKSFVYNGFNNVQVKDGEPNSKTFSDIADNYGDMMTQMVAMQQNPTKTSRTTALGATMNIGIEYTLQQYDRLKFGILSTTRFQGAYTWNEERFSATCSPLKWLEGSVNLGVGTIGTSFGWALNIHPKGFNLFMGMDHTFGTLSKQGIPLKASNDFSIGINFPFGRSTIKSKKFPGQKDI